MKSPKGINEHTIEEIENRLDGRPVFGGGDGSFIAVELEIISYFVKEIKLAKNNAKISQDWWILHKKIIANLREENKRLREALEFYGEKNHYYESAYYHDFKEGTYITVSCYCGVSVDIEDGAIARKALEGE